MKNVFLILLMTVISHSAMAMHAYGEDSCVTEMMGGGALQISLINGMPMDPHIIRDTSYDSSGEPLWVDFRGSRVGHDDGGDLVLKTKSESNRVSHKTSDGCFEGYEATSVRTVVVVSASKTVNTRYGLKKGQTLIFTCYDAESSPEGSHCN